MTTTKFGGALLLGIALAAGVLTASFGAPQDGSAQAAQTKEPAFKELAEPGKKNWINDSFYFTYRPSESPKIGTIVLRVHVFNKKGKKDTSFSVEGQYGMASMPGAHDSGLQPFKKNKKGVYLLPVTIVMRGEWEVRLVFSRGGNVLFRGALRFDV